MNKDIIGIIAEVILFLIASYFIFYKSWLKAIGQEIAKLSTIEKLTQLEENVKKEFNESLESYKSKLSEDLSLKISFGFGINCVRKDATPMLLTI